MSFGVAGGLDPALAPGDLVCTPESLAQRFAAKGSSITTVEAPALTPAEKSALRAQSNASAVDMESGSIEGVASAHGLAFYCVRAICDTAGDTIPPLALKGVDALGNTRAIRVAAGLVTRPQDLAALLTLGKRQKAALAALKAVAAQIMTA
jgi:nucleoside phosphorylase